MACFKILGSCSGTEPMPGRHHISIVLSAGDRNYFFDAGENAAYSAYNRGVDFTRIRAIFVSHNHFDHIAGLLGVLWVVGKLGSRHHIKPLDDAIKVYLPEKGAWPLTPEVLEGAKEKFSRRFDLQLDMPTLGNFYKDDNISVTAFESHHMPRGEEGQIRSFSYRIETEGKTAVFSGDVKSMEDLIPVVGEGCDLLLCETGHHAVQDVCEFAATHNVKRLVFVHHGREILEERPTVKEAVDACPIPLQLAEDGMDVEL